jgi:hypothetical protein
LNPLVSDTFEEINIIFENNPQGSNFITKPMIFEDKLVHQWYMFGGSQDSGNRRNKVSTDLYKLNVIWSKQTPSQPRKVPLKIEITVAKKDAFPDNYFFS